jgi:hypothetical protein
LVAQGNNKPTIDFAAKGWRASALPRKRFVAIGIAGSGRVGTIALQEGDRRAAGGVQRTGTDRG